MCAPCPPQSRRYKGLKPGELPTCESLKDTIARALPYWNDVIAPEIKAGKNVIIAAHGNSLRGIVKHLEGELGEKRWKSTFFKHTHSDVTATVVSVVDSLCHRRAVSRI